MQMMKLPVKTASPAYFVARLLPYTVLAVFAFDEPDDQGINYIGKVDARC